MTVISLSPFISLTTMKKALFLFTLLMLSCFVTAQVTHSNDLMKNLETFDLVDKGYF